MEIFWQTFVSAVTSLSQKGYRRLAHQNDLSGAARGFYREKICFCQRKSCTNIQESGRKLVGQGRGIFSECIMNTDVRTKGRIEVHMRAPVEIISIWCPMAGIFRTATS